MRISFKFELGDLVYFPDPPLLDENGAHRLFVVQSRVWVHELPSCLAEIRYHIREWDKEKVVNVTEEGLEHFDTGVKTTILTKENYENNQDSNEGEGSAWASQVCRTASDREKAVLDKISERTRKVINNESRYFKPSHRSREVARNVLAKACCEKGNGSCEEGKGGCEATGEGVEPGGTL